MKIRLTTLILICLLLIAGSVGITLLVTNKDFGIMETTKEDKVINAEKETVVGNKISEEVEEKAKETKNDLIEADKKSNDEVLEYKNIEEEELKKILTEIKDYESIGISSFYPNDDGTYSVFLYKDKKIIISESEYKQMIESGKIILNNENYTYYSKGEDFETEYVKNDKSKEIVPITQLKDGSYIFFGEIVGGVCGKVSTIIERYKTNLNGETDIYQMTGEDHKLSNYKEKVVSENNLEWGIGLSRENNEIIIYKDPRY